jgi:replication initiation and membrane attachment protein DnaB
MDKEKNDNYCWKIYERYWKGKQVEFMEKYGNNDVSFTFGTLSKWLNKKTLSSSKCKQAVKQFVVDLEKNGEHNLSLDTTRQLVSFFKFLLIHNFL